MCVAEGGSLTSLFTGPLSASLHDAVVGPGAAATTATRAGSYTNLVSVGGSGENVLRASGPARRSATNIGLGSHSPEYERGDDVRRPQPELLSQGQPVRSLDRPTTPQQVPAMLPPPLLAHAFGLAGARPAATRPRTAQPNPPSAFTVHNLLPL